MVHAGTTVQVGGLPKTTYGRHWRDVVSLTSAVAPRHRWLPGYEVRGPPEGMTARQQTRVGRRLRGERTPIDATSAPSVGEMLHAAREKKGVDLYRAERDTKI